MTTDWDHGDRWTLATYGAAAAVSVIGLWLLRRWVAGGVCRCSARLDGKTVLITGANTGIGKETARDMARRGTGVIALSLHPGVIRTELGRHVETWFPLMGVLMTAPSMLLMKTPTQGAQTSIYCAVTPGLEALSGGYFSDCKEKRAAEVGRDNDVARRLWDVSAQLVGLSVKE
ncbi:unnamed protein product [Merluccius merluccius]